SDGRGRILEHHLAPVFSRRTHMPIYTQATRAASVRTALGADELLLARLQGTEAISELFHFRLEMLARSPASFDAVLGEPATVRLTVPGCPERHVNGIISSLEQGPRLQGPEGVATFVRYRAELVPAMWLCGLRQQSRVFQNMTVPQILHQVL